MPIAFDRPIYLILCLLVPIVWVMMNRSLIWQTSPTRKFMVATVRSLLVVLLALTLADPHIKAQSDRVNLFFLRDVSESVGRDTKPATDAVIDNLVSGMGKEDTAGLIIFGKHPSLETPLTGKFRLQDPRSAINRNYTNIHEALQFAIGKFPPKGDNRIVLFSDGNENLQETTEMAYLAASLGIEIYPVPVATWFGKNEVYIQALETPPVAPLDTPFEIKIIIGSSEAKQGELILFRNDRLLMNDTISLEAGKNVFTFSDVVTESGLYLYRAVGNFAEDVFFQNNEGLSFTQGTRKSKVLYITGDNTNSHPFPKMLREQGLNLIPKTLEELSGSLHSLLDYNAIILDNVSGESMSFTTMENLEKYVKEMGGGLIMIGGDKSFGAGRYHKTPVEKALPVHMDAPTDLKFSALCLVFIIDKSSSMSASYKDKSKLEMAKIAAFSSIEMLNPTDRVGVLAFDTEPNLIVPITKATDRTEIAGKLSKLEEGGGTTLYPALEEAFNLLNQIQATKKHVLVLSDGLTEEADFQALVQKMSANDISVSTVSIGMNSDVDLMKAIATWGKGRSYYTNDPDSIPNIFTGETRIVAKNLILEKAVKPYATRVSDILMGIDPEELPVIYGQVVTYPKPGASVLINTDLGPLLSVWRYGLGRSVAFTSDLAGRWGKNWVSWDHYGRFCSQMVKWAQKKETPNQFFVMIDRKGENGRFTVDVTNNQNQFLNRLDLNVKILFPSKSSKTIPLEQTAPGRYHGEFPTEELGDYYFSLFGDESDEFNPPQVYGYGIPYTDEFNTTGVNEALLEKLASITHGKVLSPDNLPNDLFTETSALSSDGTPIWPYLAMLFLVCLIGDVAIRKFIRMSQ